MERWEEPQTETLDSGGLEPHADLVLVATCTIAGKNPIK